jgi:hypothetical protein
MPCIFEGFCQMAKEILSITTGESGINTNGRTKELPQND